MITAQQARDKAREIFQDDIDSVLKMIESKINEAIEAGYDFTIMPHDGVYDIVASLVIGRLRENGYFAEVRGLSNLKIYISWSES